MYKDTCKICDSSLINCLSFPGKPYLYRVDCPRCGYYHADRDFLDDVNEYAREERSLFSGYIRNTSSEENPVHLTAQTYKDIPEIIFPYKRLTVSQRINNLIKFIYEKAENPSKQILIQHSEIYRFYIQSIDDYYMLINYLTEKRYIKNPEHPSGKSVFWLTVEGWEKYESLKEININSKIAFVAMSFDPTLKPIFTDFIQPACQKCGFDAERVDSREHNEKICDRIIAKINESRFVIADFTQNKHGVYFEAGYAVGIGISVIWTCSEAYKEELHFDTRQYNHILWKDGNDLKGQLIDRINATVSIKK